eukprot:CAMPEP_0204606288 /NCGR_PEP_ID=MMETSP0661-20131031/59004_1 /ASSEMBLY_ACC=CAM_ASM_000606 /TAXON_ID=109239 /ORGANISM="Alexandrium margalefi, Strain AMGDE01CS-322" /LENGTH=244 /DNA_ID=CAMNT_0051617599 /DNA_START=38 /DNA_END=772 /DNA_ORIENTATION=+
MRGEGRKGGDDQRKYMSQESEFDPSQRIDVDLSREGGDDQRKYMSQESEFDPSQRIDFDLSETPSSLCSSDETSVGDTLDSSDFEDGLEEDFNGSMTPPRYEAERPGFPAWAQKPRVIMEPDAQGTLDADRDGAEGPRAPPRGRAVGQKKPSSKGWLCILPQWTKSKGKSSSQGRDSQGPLSDIMPNGDHHVEERESTGVRARGQREEGREQESKPRGSKRFPVFGWIRTRSTKVVPFSDDEQE